MAKKTRKITINKQIEDIMAEAFFMPMFFVVGIDTFVEKIATMEDKEVSLLFGEMIAAKAIRTKVAEIHKILHEDGSKLS